MDTSTICDSEDFNEEEWRSQIKKHRRDNAKRIYSNGSSDEDTRLSEEECTIRRRRKAPNDECHYEKKIKRIYPTKVTVFYNCHYCLSNQFHFHRHYLVFPICT